MKNIFTAALFILLFFNAFSQSSIGTPDSIANISYPNSTGQYTISNPLIHNSTSFTNAPLSVNCFSNCKSDYLYFYDLDLNIPGSATITGVEIFHERGGCNAGSYVIDTLHLAYNNAIFSSPKRDSTSSGTDTLGAPADLWGASLTPAIVNDNSFGVFINSTGFGICTFGQFNVQVKVYYSTTSGINDESMSSLKIYPNPVKNYLMLDNKDRTSNETYSIFNAVGELVLSGDLSEKRTKINTSSLNSGLFFLKTNSNSKVVKFVKNTSN